MPSGRSHNHQTADHPAPIEEPPTVSARILKTALAPAAIAIAGLLALTATAEDKPAMPDSVLKFPVKDIDGKPVDLAKYKGDVLLIVNVASKCGLTPQYEGLEATYEKYKGQGFEVLGFPANEFGKQEPGTNEEIKTFCTGEYKVTFPMFSKIVVKGPGIDPLYKFLTSRETNPKFAGDISWNFAKFLVDRKGKVIARFDPREKPDSEKVVKAIEAALAEPK
jgi:glutathione peroxidase